MPAPQTVVTAPTAPTPAPASAESREAGSGSSGGSSQPKKFDWQKGEFRASDFKADVKFKETMAKDGTKTVEELPIVLDSNLKTKFEGVLDSFAGKLQLAESRGKTLDPYQSDFLRLYRENKSTLLDSPQGWILSKYVIEQEMFLRLAKLQKDVYLEIKGMKPSTDEITLTHHELQGLARKIAIGGLKVGVSPFVGLGKLCDSLAKHESVKVKFEDFNIDTTALPQGYREYMELVDPAGTDPEGTLKVITDAQDAISTFYTAFGASPVEVQMSTPWEKFVATGNTVDTKMKINAEWTMVQNDVIRAIRAEGLGPGGRPLNLANLSHRGWFVNEFYRRCVHEYSSKFLTEIAKSQVNTRRVNEVIDAKLGETASPEAAQKSKDKKVKDLREQIDELNGRDASEGHRPIKGKIKELEDELTKLQGELKPSGGTPLEDGVKTAKAAYDDERIAYARIEAVIRKKRAEIQRLRNSVPQINARFDAKKLRIQNLPTFQAELVQYRAAIRAGLRKVAEIQTDIQEASRPFLDQMMTDIAALGQNPNPVDEARIKAAYKHIINTQTHQLGIELRSSQHQWRRFDRVIKREGKLEELDRERDQKVETVNASVAAAEAVIETKDEELAVKGAEVQKKKGNYDKNRTRFTALNRSIGRLEASKKREQAKLDKLLKKLEEAQGIDITKLEPKMKAKREKWLAIKTALASFDTIVGEVQNGESATKLGLEVPRLTSTRMLNEPAGQFLEGYLVILDEIFQYKHAKSPSEALKTAMSLVSTRELAGIMRDRFNLTVGPGALVGARRNSLNAVFTTMRSRNISQADMGLVMVDVLKSIAKKGIYIQ